MTKDRLETSSQHLKSRCLSDPSSVALRKAIPCTVSNALGAVQWSHAAFLALTLETLHTNLGGARDYFPAEYPLHSPKCVTNGARDRDKTLQKRSFDTLGPSCLGTLHLLSYSFEE